MDEILTKKELNYLASVGAGEKENNLDVLKRIVREHQYEDVKFNKGGKIRVDGTTANMLLTLYNALKPATQEKFVRMINNSKADFVRTVDFGWSKIK